MKNKFDKQIIEIRKLFKKPFKNFLQAWKKEPDLLDFIQVYDNDFASNMLDFVYGFIYVDFLEKQQDFNQEIFKNPDYYNVLKSIALLTLASQNSFTKNIFKNGLQGYHNDFELKIDSRINLEIQNSILISSNIIYTLAFYLTKLLNKAEQIELVYNAVYSYFVFTLLKTDLPIISKKIMFWKKETIDVNNYAIQYEIELDYFKDIQINLRQLFPFYFNDLIYIINSNWSKLKN